MALDPPLVARNGGPLRVACVGRISTEHQDRRSLDDQQALMRDWLNRNYSGETKIAEISGRGSGESLIRPEAEELVSLIESNAVDLILAEDLGRIYRRIHAVVLCEECLDQGIRVITINDNLDTFQLNWRTSGMFTTLHHEQHNADTGMRIRRSLRNRFMQGGVVQTTIFGYVKPAGATSDVEVSKLPEAEAIYGRWFSILEEGGTYSDVMDYLNANQIPVGPFSRVDRWTVAMVARITQNPILKGLRMRNRKKTIRINRTGKHKSVDAPPEELLTRNCPHLAFIDPERFDRVNALLKIRNMKYKRHLVDGVDPRKGVSRKRTRWPGQHIYCGVCGKMFVFGAHGQTDSLMCKGAREYQCWMSTSVNVVLAREKLVNVIWQEVENLPDFAAEMRAALKEAAVQQNEGLNQQLAALDRRKTEHSRHVSNLQRAILEYGPSEFIQPEMKRLQQEADELKVLDQELQRRRIDQVRVPRLDEIKSELKNTLDQVVADSQDAARLLRRMIPQIIVHPYRLLDRGHNVLRAELVLDLSAAWPGQLPSAPELKRSLTVDLFDPPQREKFREQVVQLRAAGMKERDVAQQLGITQPAVQNAMKLQREMEQRGVTEPYFKVTEPPANSKRYKRHLHPRFRQDPPEEGQAA